MHLVLDITASAEFWRRIYPGNRAPKATFAAPPESCATTLEEIVPLIPSWMTGEFLKPIGGRLHVLSLSETTLRGSKHHTVHIWSGAVPEGSFYYLKDNVCVLAPSFMFLIAATLLSDVQLMSQFLPFFRRDGKKIDLCACVCRSPLGQAGRPRLPASFRGGNPELCANEALEDATSNVGCIKALYYSFV